MAKQQPKTRVVKRIVNTFRDRDGRIILEMGSQSTTTSDNLGNVETEWVNNHVELMCGRMQGTGKEAAVEVAVCHECRVPLSISQRASHGLCSRDAGHTCAKCHAFLCPKHAHLSKQDGQYRCRRHALDHRMLNIATTLIRTVFCRPEE